MADQSFSNSARLRVPARGFLHGSVGVEQIRGVKCDYSLQSLTLKGLIQEVGRKETIGRPVLFGTTDEFLSRFGIESLENLPPLPEPEAEESGEPHEELIP